LRAHARPGISRHSGTFNGPCHSSCRHCGSAGIDADADNPEQRARSAAGTSAGRSIEQTRRPACSKPWWALRSSPVRYPGTRRCRALGSPICVRPN